MLRYNACMKRCSVCSKQKPLEEFNRHHMSKDGREARCKTCKKKWQQEYFKKHPDKLAVATERTRAWLSVYRKDKRDSILLPLLKKQKGRCAICKQKLDVDANPQSISYPRMDHDHKCCKRGCSSCIRGLLCRSCNYGLGCFQDDLDYLLAAADYLRRI